MIEPDTRPALSLSSKQERRRIGSDPPVLGIRDAAAFLGAHEQTVRKLARRGALPAFKIGKDWRFRTDALIRWMDAQHRARDRCSVLVVDDDETICRAMRGMLGRLGGHVRRASSGKEGLKLVRSEVPDLLLLDLQMPGMNGPQFLAQLRESLPDLPVVIVTGYPESDLMQRATQHAPLMLLSKPIESELLERTVRMIVGQKIGSHVAPGRDP